MYRCKRKVFSILATTALFAVSFAVPSTAQSADEQAIRTAAADWANAALDKILDKTVSYYAEDAHMYPYNAPRTETKEDIRKVWTAFLTAPGSVIETKTASVTVAKSGDLAYETGTFSLRQNNAQGQTDETPGKYVVVWKKQPNQEWKAVADIFNTDK
jgi:ketosteroid isomerase-like protein